MACQLKPDSSAFGQKRDRRSLWRTPIGEGYSSIAISGGRLYTLSGEEPDEFVLCLDAASGEDLWRFRSDSNFKESHGNGPRSTPTIEGDRVYAVSTKGKLYALDTKTGKQIWRRDLRKNFASRVPQWGFAASPLIEGDLLFLPVGGEGDQFMVAFDKNDGQVVWTTHSDRLAYSSPIVVDALGVRQLLVMTEHNLVSVAPSDGTHYWSFPWTSAINTTTPIFIPHDKVFVSCAYGKGAALVQMKQTDGAFSVEEVWASKVIR